MSIFSKAVYKEVSVPFIHDCYAKEYEEYLEAGCIDIEAAAEIDGETKYLYASYFLRKPHLYDNGDYEQMLSILKDTDGKRVTVRLKFKKERLVGFEILKESLAAVLDDARFLELDLAGWNINNTSCKENESTAN
ncbi:MAG: hypothetical protein IKL87_03915 [Oscillospiraceae bacterium]|nr:hypothetical protein [Oscillospiraceae bacterium]